MMRHFWIILLAVLSVSCQFSMTKKEKTKNLIKVPYLGESTSKSLSTSFFKTGKWPSSKWWRVFENEDLNHFMTLALENNPTLQEAKKRVEQVRQEAIITKARLFPLVGFKGNNNQIYSSHNGLYRGFNPTFPIIGYLVDLLVHLYYDFDIWGRNQNLFYASVGKTMAMKAEHAQAELVISVSVAQTYFALKANLVKKKLIDELVLVRKGIYELENKMRISALRSILEPLAALEKLQEAKKLQSSIETEVEVLAHLLNTLMGKSPDCAVDILAYLEPFSEKLTIPCELSLNLLARRPDLMAQIWRVEALAYEVGASIADYYPDLSIEAFLGFESTKYRRLLSMRSLTWNANPIVGLPIFTKGAISANVSAKKAAFDAAIYSYNTLVLDAAKQTADTLSQARDIFKQKIEQESIVNAASKRLEVVSLKLKKGLDNKFNAYALEEELIDAKIKDIMLLFEEYFIAIKLIESLGGGYAQS
jgi:NodT family efflux transporter outer membrane factor (OMF) lipoprotein